MFKNEPLIGRRPIRGILCFQLNFVENEPQIGRRPINWDFIFSQFKFKGVIVAFWYLSIMPQNNSRAVAKNLRMLVCRSRLRLTIFEKKDCHHEIPWVNFSHNQN